MNPGNQGAKGAKETYPLGQLLGYEPFGDGKLA
jgi:hypothetical protein